MVELRGARLPRHIGLIPDGDRRWAQARGMEKRSGYASGIDPAFDFYDRCKVLGTEEVSFYGFAQENTRRPRDQREAFQKACVDGVKRLEKRDADFLIVGDSDTPMFPPELKRYTERTRLGKGGLRINLLINYSWSGTSIV